MTLDYWGLGLQAVNVLILIWLLSRVFWRPVAAAIAARQAASQAALDKAETAQKAADTALAEARKSRDGNDAARAALLDAARREAEAASQTILADAATQAEARRIAAAKSIAKDQAAATKDNAVQAAALSVQIATRMLQRLAGPVAQTAFLDLLHAEIAKLSGRQRNEIAQTPEGIDIILPADPGAEKAAIETDLRKALGGAAQLRFVTDPSLIAGIELRTAHFTLRNSWQADLALIEKAVLDAV